MRTKARRWLPLAAMVAGLLPLVCGGCGSPAQSTESGADVSPASTNQEPGENPNSASASSEGQGTAIAARQKAAEEGRYLFVFFWKTREEQTEAMRDVFKEATARFRDRADAIEVSITDPAEKAIVDEYGLDRAPMPLVLAIAPNGAITGGFPGDFSQQDLLGAFATPCTQQCMKCLQDGKLVLLCVQNDQTAMNEEAMQGVKDFAMDDRFHDATELVWLDPSVEEEKPFLNDLQIDPDTKTAVTVLLVPPGSPIAMFEGATTKEQLLAELQKAGSCGPGGVCGPGGCAPR